MPTTVFTLNIRTYRFLNNILSPKTDQKYMRIPRKSHNHKAQPYRGTKGRKEEEEIRTAQRHILTKGERNPSKHTTSQQTSLQRHDVAATL